MRADASPASRRERIVASPWYKGWCWAMAASSVGLGLFGLLAGLSPVFPLILVMEGSVFVSIRVTARPRLYRVVQVIQAGLVVALVVTWLVLALRVGGWPDFV